MRRRGSTSRGSGSASCGRKSSFGRFRGLRSGLASSSSFFFSSISRSKDFLGRRLLALRIDPARHGGVEDPFPRSNRGGATMASSSGSYDKSFRVDGKVALVTGGARGLGAEICRALASGGAAVLVTDVL